MLNKYSEAAIYNVNSNVARAKLLRITSWMIITSFVLVVLTTSGTFINYSQTGERMGIMNSESMSNRPDDEDGLGVSQPETETVSTTTTISTHSEGPPDTATVIT